MPKPPPASPLRRLRFLFGRRNRQLALEMTRATLKVRHQNSVLGIAWNLMGPALTLLVLYLVFSRHFGEALQAYPLFLLTGIIVVGFFSGASRHLVTVFERTSELTRNSLVPAETAVFSNLVPYLVALVVESALCLVLAAGYGGIGGPSVLLLPLLLLSLIGVTAGLGLILGALYTAAQDIEQIWSALARLFFFATPVFYDLGSVSPEIGRMIYWVNPLTPILMAMRSLLGASSEADPGVLLHGLLLGPAVLLVGYAVFLLDEDRILESA